MDNKAVGYRCKILKLNVPEFLGFTIYCYIFARTLPEKSTDYMFYRRKILLALIEAFNGRLEKIQLQKLLMLFAQKQQKPAYHFVPYKYGCFSFQANADLVALTKQGFIAENNGSWEMAKENSFQNTLLVKDSQLLKSIKRAYAGKTSEELIRITYVQYPYYAINSLVAATHLSEEELDAVAQQRPKGARQILFTIGYEGLSLEEYINKLIRHDVKVLCDVRKNSFSMKYGFSKTQLQKACEGVGISFIHLPQVGIPSDQRRALHTQEDYDILFEGYRKAVLPQTIDTQEAILQLIETHQRVALTCFEANICQCHRTHLANAISQLPNFSYQLKHI